MTEQLIAYTQGDQFFVPRPSPLRDEKKPAQISLNRFLNSGGTSGGRTHDKRIKSPLLYQLSYGPIKLHIGHRF